jgi:hypothetical protein
VAEGLRIEGTEEWRRCAVDLKAAADKDLLKAVRKSIRDLAKPVGRFVLDRGAEAMPASGGLAARMVETGKVGVSAGTAGKNPKITINLSSPKSGGASVGTADKRGMIRHPVYGRGDRDRKSWAWVRQNVEAGTFTKAFEEQADEVADAVLSAVEKVMRGIG